MVHHAGAGHSLGPVVLEGDKCSRDGLLAGRSLHHHDPTSDWGAQMCMEALFNIHVVQSWACLIPQLKAGSPLLTAS